MTQGDEIGPSRTRARFILDRTKTRIGAIIMGAAEDALTAVADQLDKSKSEIDSLVAALEAQNVSPELVDRLRGVSQSLDDVVPDVTPPPGV